MLTFRDYRITEQLHESANSLVYRGIRETDQQSVVIKVLKDLFPSPQRIARFQREYDLMHNLHIPGIVTVYALQLVQGYWCMFLEDFGGESLSRLGLLGNIPMQESLEIACTLTDTLGIIHQHHIVHKDINPSNIVYNRHSKTVKFIDFGISTVLSRETPTFRNPSVLEGTLAYISPEQTGRMNRAIDYRSDFYSLGTTLYALFTGYAPFTSSDPLELVHSHIARQPPSPHSLNTAISPALSAILLKLMAKNAEERYQSTYGLKADLDYVVRELADQTEESAEQPSANTLSSRTVNLAFVPGQYDISDKLVIPQKLYGRETDTYRLIAAFEQTCQSNSQLILVSGSAGIGKSALVQEIHKPVTRQRGYFIAGKFDQLQRDIPYSALINAFGDLIHQLLTESREELARWRENLLEALGPNGQVIIDIIPDLELIIGEQPAAPPSGTAEAQNRFNLVFQRFIQVFTRPQHPLVLFVDDMQWIDSGSLDVIAHLLVASSGEQQTGALLIIGAYRENEVDASHPLHMMIETIQHEGVAVHSMQLSPLDASATNQFVADTLHRTTEITSPLADILLTKTGGNPFFMAEFLKSLYREDLLSFDYEQGYWQWNLADIQARQITDNVVDLMTSRVEELATSTRSLLKLVACLGNQFDLESLATVAQQQPTETARSLEEALTAGLIVPLSDEYRLATFDVPGLADELKIEYRFAHDRIQQAVYSLIDSEERQSVHWTIGLLLLHRSKEVGEECIEDNIFDIVSHLNQGYGIHLSEDQYPTCDDLAAMNLLAGKKARASAAYASAATYMQMAVDLLACYKPTTETKASNQSQRDPWSINYPLTLEIYNEATETAYLTGNFEHMTLLAEVVLVHSTSLHDKVRVYETTIMADMAQNKHLDAIHTALDVLEMLGVSFPDDPQPTDFMQGLEEVNVALEGKEIEDIFQLPTMSDPHMLAAMRILASVTSAAYLAAPQLSALISVKQVILSLTHGNAPMSPFAYAMHGLILCGVLGDIPTGYRFGKLALNLAEQPAFRSFKASTIHVANAGVRHWKDPLPETLPSLLHAYQSGLETGDVQYAASAAYMHIVNAYHVGHNLTKLAKEKESFSRTLAHLKQEGALTYHEIYRQAILNLLSERNDPWNLTGEAYDETTSLPTHEAANDVTAIHLVFLHKLILCYLAGKYEQAVAHAARAEATIVGVTGSTQVPVFSFYDSLARLALLAATNADQAVTSTDAETDQPNEHLEKVAANQEKLHQWATHAPANHLHRWHLVEAERAALSGQAGTAWEQYQRSIMLAQQQHAIIDEALAHERAALFYRQQSQDDISNLSLRKAHLAYARWGALCKVHMLEQHYPYIFSRRDTSPIDDPHSTIQLSDTKTVKTDSDTQGSQTLDMATVIKASQAISGEIVLDTLLTKLMYTMLENAGAERGVLLLDKAGEWIVEAQVDIERNHTMILQSIPLNEASVPQTIINYVAHSRENVVLPDATDKNPFMYDNYIIKQSPRSILCTPLVYHSKLTGIFYLENNQSTGAFTADRLEVLNLLYGQVAISIENARLYTNVQASEKKYRKLFEDSKDAIFITTPDGIMRDINPAGLALFGYTQEETINRNIIDRYVHLEDHDRLLHEMAEYGSIKDFEVSFYRKDGSVIDCLMTASIRQAEDNAPITFHGILRDVTEQKRAERERLQLTAMQRELSIARDIQQSLLPPATPAWQSPQVVCYNTPAREVGGDLYTYYAFEEEQDRRYAVAVGDVTGKGTPAALLMAVTMASFRSLVTQALSPNAFLSRLDATIVEYTGTTRQNCALVYVDITIHEQGNSTMRTANAGCIPPIIKWHDGKVSWVEVGGLPLGINLPTKPDYQEATLAMQAGDMVVLTSDGVVEAMNADGEMFGFERLEAAVVSSTATCASALLAHIQATVHAFTGDTELHDDMTIVVVQEPGGIRD